MGAVIRAASCQRLLLVSFCLSAMLFSPAEILNLRSAYHKTSKSPIPPVIRELIPRPQMASASAFTLEDDLAAVRVSRVFKVRVTFIHGHTTIRNGTRDSRADPGQCMVKPLPPGRRA